MPVHIAIIERFKNAQYCTEARWSLARSSRRLTIWTQTQLAYRSAGPVPLTKFLMTSSLRILCSAASRDSCRSGVWRRNQRKGKSREVRGRNKLQGIGLLKHCLDATAINHCSGNICKKSVAETSLSRKHPLEFQTMLIWQVVIHRGFSTRVYSSWGSSFVKLKTVSWPQRTLQCNVMHPLALVSAMNTCTP